MNFATVAFIVDKLNKNNISWAVGASVMLCFHGLVESPNDMDIIVAEKDIEKAKLVLDSIGNLLYDGSKDHTEIYLTKYFYKYEVKDVQIDVMSGFILRHNKGVYEFPFDSRSIASYKELEGIKVPLTSLEDWYILYQLMPNREPKVRMIEEYLERVGIKNEELLYRAIKRNLPDNIIVRVNELINKHR